MRIIVPLAGPDFVSPDGSVKAEYRIEGRPLLRLALESRPWSSAVSPEDYVFVFIDRHETRAFAAGALARWYPGAATCFLSDTTRGAALSAMAGLAGHRTAGEPLIVDLADIIYESDLEPVAAFAREPNSGAIALTFESNNPVYSYLATAPDGRVTRAAEKVVISRNASAGTYVFASTSIYLRALAHALENEPEQSCGGLFYVCPLFNGILATGLDVSLSVVTGAYDIKTLYTTSR